MMIKNIDLIFEYIKQKKEISFAEILNQFKNINESTVIRNLNKLIEEGKVSKEKTGKDSVYRLVGKEFILEYLKKDFFERPSKGYNFDFLNNYIPNKSSFLGKEYNKIKEKYLNQNLLSTYDYKQNIRGIENLLIDISFASSKLEGNTYSYLDTEILIKYNNVPEGKTKVETQMILNHKNAIKYIIENKNQINFNKNEFENIHILLGKGLLTDDYLGKIRHMEVKIGGSSYTPMDNHHQLEQEFEKFLDKLNKIRNPFEQALFILVFIPYFQLFMDINKRTSRISTNIPLIKNGYVPFSFLQISDRDYINAILSIYELNDVSLMSELFVDNYLLNMKRYS